VLVVVLLLWLLLWLRMLLLVREGRRRCCCCCCCCCCRLCRTDRAHGHRARPHAEDEVERRAVCHAQLVQRQVDLAKHMVAVEQGKGLGQVQVVGEGVPQVAHGRVGGHGHVKSVAGDRVDVQTQDADRLLRLLVLLEYRGRTAGHIVCNREVRVRWKDLRKDKTEEEKKRNMHTG